MQLRDKSCLCVSSSNCVDIYLLSAFTDICANSISDGSGINWQRLASLVLFIHLFFSACCSWSMSKSIVFFLFPRHCSFVHAEAIYAHTWTRSFRHKYPRSLVPVCFRFPNLLGAEGWRSGDESERSLPPLLNSKSLSNISRGCLSVPSCTKQRTKKK